jgi:hypothetical protein
MAEEIRLPETPSEWQDAANWCEGLLALDSARQYGLVTGGPKVNVDRCIAKAERKRKAGAKS